jgi:hypothetical protein
MMLTELKKELQLRGVSTQPQATITIEGTAYPYGQGSPVKVLKG